MSKSDRIKRLIGQGFTRRQIALLVGVSQSYVRAVVQRMIGGGLSSADRKYIETMPEDVRLRLQSNKRRYLRERGRIYRATGSYRVQSEA